jgi:hypothetical protein
MPESLSLADGTGLRLKESARVLIVRSSDPARDVAAVDGALRPPVLPQLMESRFMTLVVDDVSR